MKKPQARKRRHARARYAWVRLYAPGWCVRVRVGPNGELAAHPNNIRNAILCDLPGRHPHCGMKKPEVME